MKIKNKDNKGISLIVLVITIIIMIILAAAVILSLNSSNVINKAGEGKTKSDFALVAERRGLLEAEILLGNIPSTPEIIENYTLTYNQDSKNIDIKYKEGETQVIIPEGFRHIEGTISSGLVISDEKGNEFVWVPVGIIDGGLCLREWNSGQTIDSIHLTSESGIGQGDNDSGVAGTTSIQKYGGFYISRYKAGKPNSAPKTDGTDKPLFKKGTEIWNDIELCQESPDGFWDDWDSNGAYKVATNAYTEGSVTSSIPSGAEWDTIMKWISDSGVDVTNETTWGNNAKTKNIYDLANGGYEWTSENAYNDPAVAYRIAAKRMCGDFPYDLKISFRISLYIK